MSRNRAFAFLLTVFATVAMTLGLSAGAATAAPAKPKPPKPSAFNNHNYYPPLPPMLVVNKGVVSYGASVKASGRMYGNREKVIVTVVFRPKGSSRYRVLKTTRVRTSRTGEFSVKLKLKAEGMVVITATGKGSRKSASAAVFVFGKHGGGWWDFRRASYTTDATTAVPAKVSDVPSQPRNVAGLAAAGLGVLALAGSTLITRRVIRRRQRA